MLKACFGCGGWKHKMNGISFDVDVVYKQWVWGACKMLITNFRDRSYEVEQTNRYTHIHYFVQEMVIVKTQVSILNKNGRDLVSVNLIHYRWRQQPLYCQQCGLARVMIRKGQYPYVKSFLTRDLYFPTNLPRCASNSSMSVAKLLNWRIFVVCLVFEALHQNINLNVWNIHKIILTEHTILYCYR